MAQNSIFGPVRYGIYDDNAGLVGVEDFKIGDIITANNYPSRYISKKVQSGLK